MTKNYIAVILLFVFAQISFAQDAHFSQYYNSPQMINPAMIGEGLMKGRFIFNFRNQGNFTTNPYKTIAFSGDTKLKQEKLSSGILFLHDKSGDGNYSTNDVCLSLAPSVEFNKEHSLKLGFQAGWTQYTYDAEKLTWNSQFDGTKINAENPSGESLQKGFGYFDISLGLLYKYQMKNKHTFRFGVSAFHLSHPILNTFSAKSIDIRWCGYSDAMIVIKNSSTRILPSILYMKQGTANEFAIGSSVKCKIGANLRSTPDRIASFAYIGTYYRSNDAIMVMAGLSFQEQMIVTASYDITTSQLSTATKRHGGIEFSVVYVIQN